MISKITTFSGHSEKIHQDTRITLQCPPDRVTPRPIIHPKLDVFGLEPLKISHRVINPVIMGAIMVAQHIGGLYIPLIYEPVDHAARAH